MSATLPEPVPAPDDQDLSALAVQWGLSSSSARQPMGSYVRELWSRRYFIIALGSGRKSTQYRDTSLGRLWQVLGPILNAIVYYFIFGILLQTSKGVENFAGFLIIGVFTFTYTQRAVNGGMKSIVNNRQIIRAIHFPRAVLPLSVIVQEVQQQVVTLGVLGVIVKMGQRADDGQISGTQDDVNDRWLPAEGPHQSCSTSSEPQPTASWSIRSQIRPAGSPSCSAASAWTR